MQLGCHLAGSHQAGTIDSQVDSNDKDKKVQILSRVLKENDPEEN